MLKIIKQNQNIILVSVGLFLISLTALLFLVNNSDKAGHGELNADVVNAGEVINTDKSGESAYRKLINNQEDPIIVLRIDGTIEYSSPDLKSSEGYDQKILQDKLFYSLLNPEDLSIFLGAYGKAMASEEAVMMIGPYRIRGANGEYSVNMGSLYPIKSGDKVQKIILTTRNISQDLNKEAKPAESAPAEQDLNTPAEAAPAANVETETAPQEAQSAPADAAPSVVNPDEEIQTSTAEVGASADSEIKAEVTDDSAMLKADVFEGPVEPATQDELTGNDVNKEVITVQLTQEKRADPITAPAKNKYTKQKINKTKSAVIKQIKEVKNDIKDVKEKVVEPKIRFGNIFDKSNDAKDFNYKNSKIFSHKLTFKP